MSIRQNHCSLKRRLLAIIYDSCLLFSVLFFATALALPVTGGESFENGNVFYSAYLLLTSYFYFVWQWKKGRQTLGMRAWRIYLTTATGEALSWKSLTVRFMLACLSSGAFGAGFAWALFDKDKLTFHDRFSNTRLSLGKR